MRSPESPLPLSDGDFSLDTGSVNSKDLVEKRTKNSRESWGLSEEGRDKAKAIWDRIVSRLGDEPTIKDIEDAVKTSLVESPDEQDQRFNNLLEKSLRMRLERAKSVISFEQMQANPAWQSLTDTLRQKYYPERSSEFANNTLRPVLVKLNTHINELGSHYFSQWPDPSYATHVFQERCLNQINQKLGPNNTESGPLTAKLALLLDPQGESGDLNQSIERFLLAQADSLRAELKTSEQSLTTIDSIQVNEAVTTLERERSAPSSLSSRLLAFMDHVPSRVKRAATAAIFGVALLTRMGSAQSNLVRNVDPFHEIAITQSFENVQEQAAQFERRQIIEDEIFIKPGNTLYTGDILYVASLLKNKIEVGQPDQELVLRYNTTIAFLNSAKQQYPQAIKYKVVEQGGALSLSPVDWQDNLEIKNQQHTNILIAGGEIEGIVTAIRAAKQNKEVTLLFQSGQLGGLNSDTGANMAYFDGVASEHVAPPEELLELFQKGLGMAPDNIIAVPNDNLHEKLETYLKTSYPSIRLAETRTLNSLHVAQQGSETILQTEEGLEIKAGKVIDMHPDSIITEKFAGKNFHRELDASTANLAYGLVFSLRGLNTNSDMDRLEQLQNVHPDLILNRMGVDKNVVTNDPELRKSYQECLKFGRQPTGKGPTFRWGFRGLAFGYEFYSKLMEKTAPARQAKQLSELNRIRHTDGFNVAFQPDGKSTFNSLSYNLPKRLHQGDHNLQTDPEFRIIREVEIPMLKRFTEMVSGKDVSVILPREFYVRQQSVAVRMPDALPFGALSIKPKAQSPKETFRYYYDTRGFQPRDQWDDGYAMTKANEERCQSGPMYIPVNIGATRTSHPHVYSINKNAQSREVFPVARIQQYAAKQGAALIDTLNN